ncbi:MAG: hypothetical protein ACI31V_03550 [Bacilli bacterium]
MFLYKYLDSYCYDLVYDTYESSYLESLNENNFINVYNVFSKYNFYFINDIILNYMELFEMDPVEVENGILKLKEKLGNDFVYIIGNDMKYLNEILDEELEDE